MMRKKLNIGYTAKTERWAIALAMLDTEAGINEVRKVLNAIAYGGVV